MSHSITLPQLNHTIGSVQGANGKVFVQLKHLFTNSKIPDTSDIYQPKTMPCSFIGDVILTDDGMYPYITIFTEKDKKYIELSDIIRVQVKQISNS